MFNWTERVIRYDTYELDKAKVFDVGSTHTDRFACVKFLRSIADEERFHLSDIMSKANFFRYLWMVLLTVELKNKNTLHWNMCA